MTLLRRLVVLTTFVSLCAWQSTAVPSARGGFTLPQSVEPLTAGEVDTGTGFSDVSPHQLVRTATNMLYVAVPSCTQYPTCPGNAIAMRVGNQPGNMTSFKEMDPYHRPQAAPKQLIGTSAIALDRNGVIWVGYNTYNFGVHAVPFFTKYNVWGRDVRIGTVSAGSALQGKEGVAMAVSGTNVPYIVFTFAGSDRVKHVGLASFTDGHWSAPVQVDDRPLRAGQGALHPTIAFTPSNHLLIAWMIGNENVAYNNPDGTMYVREMTNHLNTAGLPSVEIPDNNFAGNPGYAADTIDQGPSLMVTADGVAELTYDDTNDAIRFWYTSGTNYTLWKGDRQPAFQQTHDPSLGPDGQGGLYIYGHGTPAGNKNGVGVNIYRMHQTLGTTTWTPFQEVVHDYDVDCSVSTRWSMFFNYFPNEVDFTYWRDHYPNEQFVTNH